jgi:hypothetical protein
VAIFPGTLEALFGVSYPFLDVWGVSRGQFEVFTLGTLAVLLVLGSLGYWRGARLRAIPGLDATSSPGTTAEPAVPTTTTLEETSS